MLFLITSTPVQSDPIYLEVDGTIIYLQKQNKKKAKLKLAIIHKGNEKRYLTGSLDTKKLKDKLTEEENPRLVCFYKMVTSQKHSFY